MKAWIKTKVEAGQLPHYECPYCENVQKVSKETQACKECGMVCYNPDIRSKKEAERELEREEKRQKQAKSRGGSSLGRGPGPRGRVYQQWRDQIVGKSGIKKGDICPCCGQYIDRNTGMVQLHHILDRDSFPALKKAKDNVFIGCNGDNCGNLLDVQRTPAKRLEAIRKMGVKIIRSMIVPVEQRPRSADELVVWCLAAHEDHGVPTGEGKDVSNRRRVGGAA